MTPWGHAVLALSSYTNPCLQVDDAALGQTNPKPGDNQNPGTKTPKPGDRRNVFRFSPADTSPGYKLGAKPGGPNSGTTAGGQTRGQTERSPVLPGVHSTANRLAASSRDISFFFGRPPRRAASGRDNAVSRRLTKFAEPRGRPLCVLRRIASLSRSNSVAARNSRLSVSVQRADHSPVSTRESQSPLTWERALDQGNCAASSTIPARTGFRSV